jgi:hypothetical protein
MSNLIDELKTDACRFCGGKGWKLRSTLRALLIGSSGETPDGPVEVDCGPCCGSGLAAAA